MSSPGPYGASYHSLFRPTPLKRRTERPFGVVQSTASVSTRAPPFAPSKDYHVFMTTSRSMRVYGCLLFLALSLSVLLAVLHAVRCILQPVVRNDGSMHFLFRLVALLCCYCVLAHWRTGSVSVRLTYTPLTKRLNIPFESAWSFWGLLVYGICGFFSISVLAAVLGIEPGVFGVSDYFQPSDEYTVSGIIDPHRVINLLCILFFCLTFGWIAVSHTFVNMHGDVQDRRITRLSRRFRQYALKSIKLACIWTLVASVLSWIFYSLLFSAYLSNTLLIVGVAEPASIAVSFAKVFLLIATQILICNFIDSVVEVFMTEFTPSNRLSDEEFVENVLCGLSDHENEYFQYLSFRDLLAMCTTGRTSRRKLIFGTGRDTEKWNVVVNSCRSSLERLCEGLYDHIHQCNESSSSVSVNPTSFDYSATQQDYHTIDTTLLSKNKAVRKYTSAIASCYSLQSSERIANIFADLPRHMWAAQALCGLARHSILEDDVGIVQEHMSVVFSTLLATLEALEDFSACYSPDGLNRVVRQNVVLGNMCGPEARYLATAVESGVVSVVHSMQEYFSSLPYAEYRMPQEYCDRLAVYVDLDLTNIIAGEHEHVE